MQPLRNRLILAALGFVLAAPVAAQDTTPAPAAPGTEAPATAPAPEAPAAAAPATEAPATTPAPDSAAPAPAAGAPAEAAMPGNGDPAKPEVMEIVKDTFGDWQVRCAPDGKECFMYQLALDQAKNPVAEVSILKLPDTSEAVAGVTIVTPLGTLLTNGVILQVDAGEKRQYPFSWCSQVGCFARFGLTKPTLDTMRRGKAGEVTLVAVNKPEAPVTLNLSLSGFTAAFDSLEVPANPTPPPAQLVTPKN